jgi:hypothetical protein
MGLCIFHSEGSGSRRRRRGAVRRAAAAARRVAGPPGPVPPGARAVARLPARRGALVRPEISDSGGNPYT